MSYITPFVKHPHGLIAIIRFVEPPPPPSPPPDTRPVVVALLDSAVGSHPWLNPPTIVATLAVPGFAAGANEETSSEDSGGLGDSSTSSGATEIEISQHGTFDAGIIRRFAPGAEILSVPVMGDSGLIEPQDVHSALRAIRDRVAGGEADRFVDIACLPFGYVQGQATGDDMTVEKDLLDQLAENGVLVVAAAGNLESDEPVYPAAFADQPPLVGPPLLSVGALEPDGSHATYSSYGSWVKHWELGTVDSIVADPPGGYARGIGTSFAATTVAAQLAVALGDIGDLNDVSAGAAIARATQALHRISVPG
jgi:hypothetical protein